MYAILDENDICVLIASDPGFHENVVETGLDVLHKKYVEGEFIDIGLKSEDNTVLDKLSSIESLLQEPSNILVIMEAIAEQYESQKADNLIIMEAQATIYEAFINKSGGNE